LLRWEEQRAFELASSDLTSSIESTRPETGQKLGTTTKKAEIIGQYALKISLFQRIVKEFEFA